MAFITGDYSPDRKLTEPLTAVEEKEVIQTINELLYHASSLAPLPNLPLLQRFIYHYQNLEYHRVTSEGLMCTFHPDEVLAGEEQLFELKFK